MKESPVSGILLEKILSNALSDDINNRPNLINSRLFSQESKYFIGLN